jgi:isopenicillin-N N-acyltransferase-like protein
MHQNYFEIEAESYHEMGVLQGQLFSKQIQTQIHFEKLTGDFKARVNESLAYLKPTKNDFPQYYEELKGYAQGAGVDVKELWALVIENELSEQTIGKCSTVISNNGLLLGHNEDWDQHSKDSVCILKRTIGDLTLLEVFYIGTLGGNSITINSNGYIQSINSLSHSDYQIGVPANIISRWLSETKNPQEDIRDLHRIKRSSGYHHSFVSFEGKTLSLECSAKQYELTSPKIPFVHTNHYIGKLQKLEDEDIDFSKDRYNDSCKKVIPSMQIEDMVQLMQDSSNGVEKSILNKRTIAQVIIDLENRKALIWLLRENEKGLVEYRF